MDKIKYVASHDPRHVEYEHEQRLKSAARSIYVPIKDDAVRQKLRELRQRVEVKNETREQRRERLKTFLAQRALDDENARQNQSIEQDKIDNKQEPKAENKIEEASKESIKIREKIAASKRSVQDHQSVSDNQSVSLASKELYGSQTGFGRGISVIHSYSPELAIVGDFGGQLTSSSLDDSMNLLFSDVKTHTGRIGDIASHAQRRLVVTGDMAGSVFLHSCKDNALTSLDQCHGHSNRITSIDLHYSGDYCVTGSHDSTWKLWDVSSTQAVWTQDTLCRPNCVRINAEGCLSAGAGTKKDADIWDLRNGLKAVSLEGHPGAIYSLAWNPCKGYELTTAGADNRCLLWDLRNPQLPTDIIYAHTDAITGLAFVGNVLSTSSFDETIKAWTRKEDRFHSAKVHRTGSRIMSIALNDECFSSGRWDRQVDSYK